MQQVLKDTLQCKNIIIDPEEDKEGQNEGDPEGGNLNEEHLTRDLPLRAAGETRWNCLYSNTIVQSDLMLSDFLGSETFANLL